MKNKLDKSKKMYLLGCNLCHFSGAYFIGILARNLADILI